LNAILTEAIRLITVQQQLKVPSQFRLVQPTLVDLPIHLPALNHEDLIGALQPELGGYRTKCHLLAIY
jgi:hypothetical protein